MLPLSAAAVADGMGVEGTPGGAVAGTLALMSGFWTEGLACAILIRCDYSRGCCRRKKDQSRSHTGDDTEGGNIFGPQEDEEALGLLAPGEEEDGAGGGSKGSNRRKKLDSYN